LNRYETPKRSKTRHRYSSRIIAPLALATDAACLLLAAPLALLLHRLFIGGRHETQVNIAAAIVAAVAFLLIRLSRDAYSHPLGRAQDADQGVVFDYFIAALLSVATIWQFGLADDVSRGLMVFYVGGAIIMLFLSRFGLRQVIWQLAKAGHIAQRVVLYGAEPETAERAYRLLELERLPHLVIVGIADDRHTRVATSGFGPVPYVGGLEQVIGLARDGELDQVLIAVPELTQQRLDEILDRLSAVSVDISLIPREALVLSSSYRVNFIGSAPVLALWQRPVRDFDNILKNLEDKLLASIGLLLLSPLLLLTAAAIKLTSDGPVLFVQRRFGFNNVEINVLKFRSMYIDRQDVSGAARTTKDDARVTPVGRIIRRLSIDELPQLWNVLKGEMSIVGPRPHATHMKVGDRFYFDAVKGYAARHRVKPGLTGLAQVRGLRGEIATIERARLRVDYDRFYIENWSLMLDLRIILETVIKLIVDRNAY
jgi:Undecaprenyl-phosphate glucose phosphotransferase